MADMATEFPLPSGSGLDSAAVSTAAAAFAGAVSTKAAASMVAAVMVVGDVGVVAGIITDAALCNSPPGVSQGGAVFSFHSLASMMVSTRVVSAGSAASSEPNSMFASYASTGSPALILSPLPTARKGGPSIHFVAIAP